MTFTDTPQVEMYNFDGRVNNGSKQNLTISNEAKALLNCLNVYSNKYVDIKEFNTVTRGHWNIENKIHWHLDFTFEQDKNTTLNKKALLNLEITHKFVLACLERVKKRYGKSLKFIRKHLSNNFEEFFQEFIAYLLVN